MTSTVYVAKSVYGGDGLGRLGDGRVVFVQGAWAGENVKAEIVEEKRHYVKARLVEVVDGSPDRISGGEESGIPGCVYAGLSFAAECAAKEEQLKDFFERARIHVGEFIGFGRELPSPLHYRNKAVYHFARQHGKWVIGYRTEPSHEILDISTDPLVVKPINDKLPEIRASVVRLLTTGPEAVRRDIERKGNVTVRWTAKSGVKFKNTRNVNEYIRAAVVANWFDANGNVVAAWDKTRDGDITLGSGWTENGGFYHTAAVAAGQETSVLFSSFTKPTSAPVTGAHFEMTILVQAVGSDGMTSCTAAFTN